MKFPYQLTDYAPIDQIQFAIDQIEKYEPKSRGRVYILREKDGEHAIFTKGDKLVDPRKHIRR